MENSRWGDELAEENETREGSPSSWNRQLKLDHAALGMSKAKTKEEDVWLKIELEHIKTEFAKEKNELEVAYQQ